MFKNNMYIYKNKVYKRKLLLVFLVVGMLFMLLLTDGYMIFTDSIKKDVSVTSGTTAVIFDEETTNPSDSSITKSFRVKSGYNDAEKDKSVIPMYVRVKFIPVVEYNNGTEASPSWVITDIPLSAIELTVEELPDGETGEANNWIFAHDEPLNEDDDFFYTKENGTDKEFKNGYYYYKHILNSGQTTNHIKATCNVTKPENLEEDIRITLKTILESSQTRNELWQDRFHITALPEGVESSGSAETSGDDETSDSTEASAGDSTSEDDTSISK